MNNLYTSIIEAKNGTKIPLLYNGRTIESKYNPENSCSLIADSINQTGFFIVTGIASGILIQKIIEKFPSSKIIAFEKTQDDIEFLSTLPLVHELQNNSQIIFTTYEKLYSSIIENYLPAIYGNFQVIQQRPWLQENQEIQETLPSLINNAIKEVSADFSVQSHFGKIWQKNILSNLQLLSKIKNSQINIPDVSKTAVIIAAGPSLDSSLKILKDNREKYIIFSTDTAYSILQKNNIFSDYVVSIDGQYLSYNHFLEINTKTEYFFDLTANFSAAKNVVKKNSQLHFFTSGHPFSELADNFIQNKFPKIYNGAGTVTIAAIDLALTFGFSSLLILGADFAYLNGKSYAKGTYLDSLYLKNSSKKRTFETTFDKLIFRIPTQKFNKNSYNTEVLTSYKKSLENYLSEKNCDFKKENNIYKVYKKNPLNYNLEQINFDFLSFCEYLKNLPAEQLKIPLLPYIAALRKNHPDETFENLVNLARNMVVSYN